MLLRKLENAQGFLGLCCPYGHEPCNGYGFLQLGGFDVLCLLHVVSVRQTGVVSFLLEKALGSSAIPQTIRQARGHRLRWG